MSAFLPETQSKTQPETRSRLGLNPKEILAQLNLDPGAIREIPSCWERSTYFAILNYLTRYRPKPNSPNVEQLRGYLESFTLLCTLNEWERAYQLLQLPLSTGAAVNRTVTDQLQIWGYAQERVTLHRQLQNRLSPQQNHIHLNGLATAYAALGEYTEAANCAQQAMTICQNLGDEFGTALSHLRLGYVCSSQGQFQAAIAYYQQTIKTAEAAKSHTKFQWLEAEALANLGGACTATGKYAQAQTIHQQSFAISQALQDRRGESYSLKDLGNVFFLTGAYDEAILHYRQAISLAKTIEDPQLAVDCLKGLGAVFTTQRTFEQAADCYEQVQEIAERIGDLKGQLGGVMNVGNIHALQRQGAKAAKCYQQALGLAIAIGDVKAEGDLNSNLGTLRHGQKDFEGAISYYQSALVIAEQTQDETMRARCLNNLGSAQRRLGEVAAALKNFQAALMLKQAIGDRHGEAQTWFNLGQLWAQRANPSEAETAYQKAGAIFHNLNLTAQAERCKLAMQRLHP